MAFVAFGKNKMMNAQQQQHQISRSNENSTATTSYQQQTITDPTTTQSIVHSDLESFHLAETEVDAKMVLRDGLGADGIFSHEPPASALKEHPVETKAEEISQLLEHNNALRQNFDNLKHLHLQLVEANAQLQEAFLMLQTKKIKVEDELMHHSTVQNEKEVLEEMNIKHAMELDILKAEREKNSCLAVELEQKNKFLEKKVALMKEDNTELNHKLEVLRYGHDDRSKSQPPPTEISSLEKDQAMNNKHTADLEYARELSLVKVEDQNYRQQAAELAHKCKHLEIDLQKAISAGEEVHQQLFALTYEKDATIIDLEQALRRLKDDRQRLEKKQKESERCWQIERHKLQAVIDEKEREEYKLKITVKEEAEQKLKESFRETVELRTLLNALEKSSTAVETHHLEKLKEMKKECDTLRQELGAALVSQKEAGDRLAEMEHLRVQLRDALAQNQEYISQRAEYRKARDEFHKKMEVMRLELAEIGATLRKEQRKWAEEKFGLLKREDKLLKAIKKKFCYKYMTLKKRSKYTSKLLATMTVNHNRLIIQMRECESQLVLAQTTRSQLQTTVGSAPSTGRTSLKVEAFKRGLFEADMKELADRQAKFLVQSTEQL